MTLEKKTFENNVAKGENAGNQHFLLLPHCVLPCQAEIFAIWTIPNSLPHNAEFSQLLERNLLKILLEKEKILVISQETTGKHE